MDPPIHTHRFTCLWILYCKIFFRGVCLPIFHGKLNVHQASKNFIIIPSMHFNASQLYIFTIPGSTRFYSLMLSWNTIFQSAIFFCCEWHLHSFLREKKNLQIGECRSPLDILSDNFLKCVLLYHVSFYQEQFSWSSDKLFLECVRLFQRPTLEMQP